jgi:hypothetical protein
LLVVGVSSMHPLIDLGSLELPRTTDAMSWEPLVRDPCVDRVLADAEVLGDLADEVVTKACS